MSINIMPTGKFRGKNFEEINPQYLMDLYLEYDSLKKLSINQKIIYDYVHNNYDELNDKINELEETNFDKELDIDYE